MKIINRKFSREYEEVERYEAGIVLSGPEVKSVREGGLRLDDSYVRFLEGQPYLVNAEISAYRFAPREGYEPKRSRRLLLNKKEIVRILTKLRGGKGLTVAPVSCYNRGAILKIEIAVVRGRRGGEKRKVDKIKKIERREKREAKEFLKRG